MVNDIVFLSERERRKTAERELFDMARKSDEWHLAYKAAEARAEELAAQLATVTDAYNSANREKNEMIAAIESLKQEIAELRGELKMSYTADDPRIVAAFERTAPVDWRDVYQGETPLGIALDSMGDEVEP